MDYLREQLAAIGDICSDGPGGQPSLGCDIAPGRLGDTPILEECGCGGEDPVMVVTAVATLAASTRFVALGCADVVHASSHYGRPPGATLESTGQVYGTDRASRTGMNFARDSASSAAGSDPATMPQPAKRRTRPGVTSAHLRAMPNSPSPRESNHPTGPA